MIINPVECKIYDSRRITRKSELPPQNAENRLIFSILFLFARHGHNLTGASNKDNPGYSMKIIFLDFDGVMTTRNFVEGLYHQGKKYTDFFGTIFKQDSIELLKDIIENTGAQIVITSDWRNHFGLIGLKIMWFYRKLPGRIYGILPKGYKARTTLIEEWLMKHKNVTTYVILDDLPENQFMETPKKFLVSINPHLGLTQESSQEAIRLLNIKN